jgi:5-methylthioadenosine/S-adenosylhomocysteine deaminase
MLAAGGPERFDLLIEGAHLLTGEDALGEIAEGRIAVAGDRIARVEPVSAGPAPQASEVIQGCGLLAIPGLINAHTHAVLSLVRGVAEDMGFAPAYTRGVPQSYMISAGEAVALARLGALEALKFGATLICDTYVHPLATLPAMGELGLRVVAGNFLHDVDFSGLPDGRWEHDAALGERRLAEAVELAERHHGGMDGRLRVQMAPHAPDTCSTPFLKQIVEVNSRLGLRMATHLAQSPREVARIREREGRTPVELLDEIGMLNDRLVAAHCIAMTDADIARAGKAGIHVAHVPKGNAGGGMMARTMALRQAGAKLALATDNLLGDMIEAMRWALCIGRLQTGEVSAAWQPSHVFAMATMNGARAMGIEAEIGSLRLGKKADLVLLDIARPQFTPMLNALGNLVHYGQGAMVRHSIIDGRIVVRDGRAVFGDETAIMREGQAAAEALWRRARA